MNLGKLCLLLIVSSSWNACGITEQSRLRPPSEAQRIIYIKGSPLALVDGTVSIPDLSLPRDPAAMPAFAMNSIEFAAAEAANVAIPSQTSIEKDNETIQPHDFEALEKLYGTRSTASP